MMSVRPIAQAAVPFPRSAVRSLGRHLLLEVIRFSRVLAFRLSVMIKAVAADRYERLGVIAALMRILRFQEVRACSN